MQNRLTNTWNALVSLWFQFLLVADQMVNVVGPGLLAVLMAAITGKRQNIAFADETLSAHAYRAAKRRRIWGVVMEVLINLLFIWQRRDEDVDRAAGKAVLAHCERAFWKEKLRRNLPPEYRDGDTTAAP